MQNFKFQVSIFKISCSKFQVSSLKISIFKIPNSKFQVPNSKFQIPSFTGKKKIFSKELQKSIKVFLIKMKKLKSRRDKWKSHLSKTVGSQSPHYLKSNPKFWLFAGNDWNQSGKALWLTIQQPNQSSKAVWSKFQLLKLK